MSDIRFNRWLHQSGTGGVSQDSSGNIGIGTTVPTMALDVRGDVNIGNTININNASGIISATTFTGTTGTFSGNVSGVDGTFTGNVSIAGTLTYEDVSNIDAVGIITAQSDIIVGGGLSVTGVSTGTKFNSTTSPNYVISDGTTEKGYIGYNGNDPFIGRKNGVGLAFQNNKVRPVDGDDGNGSNNTVDLGEPTYKFKDAYLTGTVNSAGINATGVATATTFSGNLTGNVTGNVTGDLTGNLAGISSIAAISSSISDTAVDVFVYDTTKDSDGGAWRKRTQNTSWYNETLNTSTRGSRKEFPAVAVIVAESLKVTIYDGDDPDLPMWMVFNSGDAGGYTGPHINIASPAILSAATALNGEIVITCTSTGSYPFGSLQINFLKDRSLIRPDVGGKESLTGIAKRNETGSYSTTYTYPALVNMFANDVAMTVLPNAPIDDSTGLPIPTIAVGTDGGLSVIRDDGNVFDIVYTNNEKTVSVAFNSNGNLHFVQHNNDVQFVNVPVPSQDYTDNTAATLSNSIGGSSYHTGNSISGNTQSAILGDVVNDTLPNATSGPSGLTFISNETPTGYLQGAVAYATTSYNTGWMQGDLKGAFLSDTDTTNAIEYVQNGYFNNNVNNWTIGTTGTTATLNSNRMLITAPTSGTSWGYVYQGITTEIGKTYKISLYYDRGTVDGRLNVRNDSTSTVVGSLFYADLGSGNDGKTYYNTFTATATTTYILLYSKNASGGTNAYDQISVTLEKDRSVNNKGLQVFGTVTKSAIATGAELVGYSGFSASNYLQQPNNSDLAPGTGQYSVTCWIKTSASGSNDQYIFDRGTSGSASRNLMLVMQTSGRIQFYNTNSSGTASDLQTTDMPGVADNNWHQVVGLYDGLAYRVYIDGKASSVTNTIGRDVGNDGNPLLTIGTRFNYTQTFGGNLALFRYSRTAPSAEQIKKMYEDERWLFQENAKATLYGSSDEVTALAYDDTTNLLHVGTSAGRSEFQGLRRINNTTDAVTTAISASNGFVAEQ